jgi:hypothetical protein
VVDAAGPVDVGIDPPRDVVASVHAAVTRVMAVRTVAMRAVRRERLMRLADGRVLRGCVRGWVRGCVRGW